MAAVMIAGEILREGSHLWVALTDVYGIGKKSALAICEHAKIEPSVKVRDVSEEQMDKVRAAIGELDIMIGTDLREMVQRNKLNIIRLGSFRARRLRDGLPVNGQRTKNNRQTARKLKEKIK